MSRKLKAEKEDMADNAKSLNDDSDGGVFNRGGQPPASSEEGSTSLWLITFTDIMALMLTFFVLLYSMSVPSEEEWEDITTGLNRHFETQQSPKWYEGSQDEIDISKLDFSKALNLNYLRTIILETMSKDERMKNIVLFPQAGHLIISLPQDLLFESGQTQVSAAGKQALFAIGGSLSNIRNRIEVVGHTDPRPVQRGGGDGSMQSNWELSLRRAISVADILKNVGYTRPIITRGLSSSRYDELSEGVSEERRLSLSRRVDILIMTDDGSERDTLSLDKL